MHPWSARFFWLLGTGGLGALAGLGAGAGTWITLAAGGVFLAWLALLAPPALALAVPFVLVQAAGEGLRLPGLPVALTQASYLLVGLRTLTHALGGAPRFSGSIDRAFVAFSITLLPAVAIGLFDGATMPEIREDVVPIVFFISTYVAARIIVRSPANLEFVVDAIAFGSVLAAAKLMLLAFLPVTPEWDGVWQAKRFAAEDGTTRVILRGADVYFVATFLVVLARASAGRGVWRQLPAGLAGAAGLLFAATRSNWAGAAAGLLSTTMGRLRKPLWEPRRVIATAALAGALLIAGIGASEDARRRTARFVESSAGRMWTVTFRLYESQGVLSAIGDMGALGNGLGSTYSYYDLAQKQPVRAQWSHNAYLMLLMKTGVVGLLAFLVLSFRSIRLGFQLASRDAPWAPTVLGLSGATVAILLLSAAVNKVFALSGGMFLGFAFAVFQSAAGFGPDEPGR